MLLLEFIWIKKKEVSSTYRLSFSFQIPVLKFLNLGLKALRLPGVFGQDVHQVGDVTGRQA